METIIINNKEYQELTEDAVRSIKLHNKDEFIGKVYNNYEILDIYKDCKVIKYKIKCLDHNTIYNREKRQLLHTENICEHCRFTIIDGDYLSNHKYFKLYLSIKHRCYGNHPSNKYYKNKNIIMEDEWLLDFEKFAKDIEELVKEGQKLYPGYKLTIDRIDGNGNYCKANCRMVPVFIQNQNLSSNKFNELSAQLFKHESIHDYTPTNFRNKYSTDCNTVIYGWNNLNKLESNSKYYELLIEYVKYKYINIEFLTEVQYNYLKYQCLYMLFQDTDFKNNHNIEQLFNVTAKYRWKKVKEYSTKIKIENQDELWFKMMLICKNKMINIKYISDDESRLLNKNKIVFDVRNDFEIFNLSLQEVYNKYSNISRDVINRILRYDIFPYYKPLRYMLLDINIKNNFRSSDS